LSKITHQALSALKSHLDREAPRDLRAAFAADSGRARRYTVGLDDLRMDFSKCAVNDETLALLAGLAKASGVEAQRDRMFAGEAINTTEGRAVLHTALRAAADADIRVDGENVVPQVHAVLDAMGTFSDGVRNGSILGATGKPFTDVVNIGIGGSDLGPVMATLALAPYHDGPRLHFVSNVDGAHIADTLVRARPGNGR
jgi:glucose-6-phosphate isomerase